MFGRTKFFKGSSSLDKWHVLCLSFVNKCLYTLSVNSASPIHGNDNDSPLTDPSIRTFHSSWSRGREFIDLVAHGTCIVSKRNLSQQGPRPRNRRWQIPRGDWTIRGSTSNCSVTGNCITRNVKQIQRAALKALIVTTFTHRRVV